MHTSWSHDCSIDAAELVDHAEAEGLGAIAVTDHNVFGGALEAADLARGRDLIVIPGEEVKTDGQGEVIGLFLEREIPRGMPFGDTVAAIREQGGLVYVPHPFDRMHAIPDSRDAAPAPRRTSTCSRSTTPACSSRRFNDEALRFARKYDLTMGAGSDAHVLQGVGTGALRMRAFRDPEEFLISLQDGRGAAPAEVARVPPVAEVDGPGQGEGPLGREGPCCRVAAAVTTDEIYERYLDKAITEINRLTHEIAQAADGAATAQPTGHPLANIFLLKYGPQAQELQEGVAFHGRAGAALIKSLRRLRRRPDGGLRHELRQVRGLPTSASRRSGCGASCGSSSRSCSS